MNSPYRAHPALPHKVLASANTIPFPTGAAVPPPPKPQGPSRLERLVTLEGEIRQLPNAAALALHGVNETRALVGQGQAFWIRLNRRGEPIVEVASSVARVDPQAPLLRAISACLRRLKKLDEAMPVTLKQAQKADDYPFAHGFWSPFVDRRGAQCFGGILFAQTEAFGESEQLIAKRLGQTYGHALQALTPPSLLRKISIPRWAVLAAPLLMLALFLIPVPMTSLAPFEVVAREPVMVTAPIDGAIVAVLVEPNAQVKQGDILFRFDDTVLRADAEIAGQRAIVAEAKLATAKNGAFTDVEAKRSLAEFQAEVDLAQAERDYAANLLERSVARASADGILIYASKSDLMGKPVRVGEKIMEVANPKEVAYRVDLAVHDSISLHQDARLKFFFDADPLHPRNGALYEMSYHATERPGGILAYRLLAAPQGDAAPLRIGSRGTAQISGETVSLGFYLFRRPIAALRQYFGV